MVFIAYDCSPLFKMYGNDSTMYLIMGKNLAEGGNLYIDLFDHKGPLIFWLNAIPQFFIKGTFGVWLMEIVFIVVSVLIFYKIGKILSDRWKLLVPISYILFMAIPKPMR